MAPWAGHKLLRACENTATILAIELLAGALAIDNQRPLRSTLRLEALHEQIRAAAPAQPGDHRLDGEIAALTGLVREGSLTGLIPGDGSGALSVGRG